MAACDVPNAKWDPTDPGGTYRPDLPPSKQKGTKFVPLVIQDRQPVVKDLPLTALDIFHLFCPHELVEKWVAATNESAEALQDDKLPPNSRRRS